MEYLITILVSLASAMLAFILQTVIRENRELKREKDKNMTQRDKAVEMGVVCLLRVKLIEYHGKYIQRGSISSHGLQNWLMMHEAYKLLGGNGMVDRMKDEIEELHIEQH